METTTKRPGLKEVALKVAKTMLPEFKAWCGSSDSDESSLLECLRSTFERYGEDDGYVIARMLEDDHGVESDEELVSIMSRVEIETDFEIGKLTAAWVIENKIEPQFKMDDTIVAKYGLQHIVGKIVAIDTTRATYSLQSDGLNGWAIIKFENAKELAVTATA